MSYFDTAKAITRAAFPQNAKDAMIEDYSREFPLLIQATRNILHDDTRTAITEEGCHESIPAVELPKTGRPRG
jgi:hypothetical protein